MIENGSGPAAPASAGGARKELLSGSDLPNKPTAAQTQAFNWRDHLAVHPAAGLFPLMSEPELRELGEDIRTNGLSSPIVFWLDPDLPPGKRKPTDYNLLDGRNRLDAMALVGIPFELFFGGPRNRRQWWLIADDVPGDDRTRIETCTDPYAFVISANIHRRHLTAEKKRELIARLLIAEPEKSNRQHAETIGVSHPHIAKVRKELEKSGDVETVTTSIDTKGRKQPARKKRPSDVGHLMVQDASGKSRRATKEEETAAADVFQRISKSDYMGTPCNMGAAMANPINTAWREGSEFNRANFVRLYLADVLKVAEQIKPPKPNDDDGLDIPDYLKRTAP